MFHSNHRSISHRFEAGANVCSADRRVGPLSPPLLENGLTDFDAVWFLAYLIGSPVSLRRNHQSTYRRFAGMHVLTDDRRQTTDRQTTDRRQTDSTPTIPTHWLPAMSRQKSNARENVRCDTLFSFRSYFEFRFRGRYLEFAMSVNVPHANRASLKM